MVWAGFSLLYSVPPTASPLAYNKKYYVLGRFFFFFIFPPPPPPPPSALRASLFTYTLRASRHSRASRLLRASRNYRATLCALLMRLLAVISKYTCYSDAPGATPSARAPNGRP